eukprot:TRINITY_DN4336_c0_g1_i2.p2 TRINITY_DN4336_c0_g1~~TRINITY_DN4336_c0_g1_i2.p2  ORF type:complete len:131 (+),score=18.08 TRINITY_DN4336_c0_g1_i2:36-428(+)
MAERTIIRSLLILCCLTTAAAIRLQPKWTFQERVRSDHHRTLIAEVHDDVEQRLGPLPMFVAVEYRERTSPSAEWLMGRVQIDTNRWIDVRIIHVRNANKCCGPAMSVVRSACRFLLVPAASVSRPHVTE